MNTEPLYELISRSDLTLIGYTHTDEIIKDALLSKINAINVGRVKASFNIKQHLRDIKIDEVLSDRPLSLGKLIHIDLNDVEIDTGDGRSASLGRARVLRSFVEELRGQCTSIGYKAIMTSTLYKTGEIDEDGMFTNSWMGGSSPVYASDLVITFENGGLKITKNRYGKAFDMSSDRLKKLLYI